jgi:predicted ATPase/DNA-binding SARP family transcriptional activator
MEVGILGPLRVVDGARPVEIGGARLRALLIRLAAGAGGWVSVGELVGDLWESDPPGDEVNALQSLVSRLRRVLPGAGLVESGPAGYRLAIPPESVDAIKFERLAEQGRAELASGEPEAVTRLLTEALGLWRGPALVEVAGVPYAMARVQRLEKLRLAVIDNRAAAELMLGRSAERGAHLVAELETVCERHPLRESSHELLIRALAGSGRQAEALGVYERFRRHLADELGLDPPAGLRRLHLAVLRGTDLATAAGTAAGTDLGTAEGLIAFRRRPAGSRPTNLRTPLTSFIGRDAEIPQLDAAVARSRLVTLVGPGGAGKTRLAGEVAARLSGQGADGVWMVELAPVTRAEDVDSTVLGSIPLKDGPVLERQVTTAPRDARTRIVDNVSDHNVVLILDNCEHLLDAAAKLAEHLLGLCPRLTVLTTSREPLGIVGERLWPVSPLPTPRPGASPAEALTTDAIRLFVDRAALVRPGFEATPGNLPAVVEICRRLDGLPLAIELAAARMRNLTVETLATRLDNRFDLLTAGNRTALPRQQTLRAVVAWSWDLLTESECLLAERLSVFPGGFEPSSAEAVCAQPIPDRPDQPRRSTLAPELVGDLLMSLADKSLLVLGEPTDGNDGAEPRYRMLETIREYAAERLEKRGETTALRTAHARYFLELAETAEPLLRGAGQLHWFARLGAERENLLAVLRFAVETGDADTAVRLGAAQVYYWIVLGRNDEAASWLGPALAVPGERSAGAYTLAQLMFLVGTAMSGDRQPDLQLLVERIRELVRGTDLHSGHPLLSLIEPGIAALQDDEVTAQALVEQSLLSHSDPWARAMLRLVSGMLAENYGDVETMQRQLPQAMVEFRELGDRWGAGIAVGALAQIYSAQGNVARAIEALQEARDMLLQMRASDDESYTLIRIGLLRLRLGDLPSARRDIGSALLIGDRTGTPQSRAFGVFGLASLAHYEGGRDEARRLAADALALIDLTPWSAPQLRAMVLCGTATFAIAAGAPEDARGPLAAAYEAVLTPWDMPAAAGVGIGLADLMLALGRPEPAARLIGAAVQLRGMEDRSDPEVLRVVAAARARLGPAEYDRRFTDGRNLTRDDALALLKQHL